MTPELLCDPHKGITAMFKAFPAVRFKGKGHEVTRGYYRTVLWLYFLWLYSRCTSSVQPRDPHTLAPTTPASTLTTNH